jgi:acyl-CoA synthetase (AMP-forming)/AMP-acid ligase II
MNFAAQVELNARNAPDDAALYFEDRMYTWRELDEVTDRFAGFLDAGGSRSATRWPSMRRTSRSSSWRSTGH